MRIVYIANIRLPTEKAHGVQIMKTCEAFAALGHDVELVVSDRYTDIADEPFAYYGVKRNFHISRIRVPDTVHLGRIGFLFESFVFAKRAVRHLRSVSFDVLYGRDESVLYMFAKKGLGPVVWETHTGAHNTHALRLSEKVRLIVAITQGLKDFYVGLDVAPEKIVVAHDGVDLEQFAHPESKEAARARLGLPPHTKLVMYIGRLDGWKGTDTLLEASKLLPEDISVAIIGGEQKQVAELSARYKKVKFLGYRPYKELAGNQQAADVLVLPNTGRDRISTGFTSPLKLFTYMASGVPMVVSDLPSIREIVDEQGAYFFKPDDAADLARAIQEALVGGKERAAYAASHVQTYSWGNRARVILDALRTGASRL